MAAIQSHISQSDSAHIYGTSPGNQRIEAWWSFFRRYRTQWWIEFFESLIINSLFHPGHAKEVECLRFCFVSVIQTDLDLVRRQWNTHRITPSPGARCPPGIPDELYCFPHLPAVDCSKSTNVLLPAELHTAVVPPRNCEDTDFAAYLDYICTANHWQKPTDVDTGKQLYCQLLPHCNC